MCVSGRVVVGYEVGCTWPVLETGRVGGEESRRGGVGEVPCQNRSSRGLYRCSLIVESGPTPTPSTPEFRPVPPRPGPWSLEKS